MDDIDDLEIDLTPHNAGGHSKCIKRGKQRAVEAREHNARRPRWQRQLMQFKAAQTRRNKERRVIASTLPAWLK